MGYVVKVSNGSGASACCEKLKSFHPARAHSTRSTGFPIIYRLDHFALRLSRNDQRHSPCQSAARKVAIARRVSRVNLRGAEPPRPGMTA
jgi:hypothetical protein